MVKTPFRDPAGVCGQLLDAGVVSVVREAVFRVWVNGRTVNSGLAHTGFEETRCTGAEEASSEA
jgi:hypothetical protein